MTDRAGNINEKLCISAAEKVVNYNKRKHGSLELVVVHSPAFAIAVTNIGQVHQRSGFQIKAEHVVSTVGAGDAFAAGMLYGIHEAWSIDESLELAHATAGASLRSSNTVDAVASVQDCLNFARSLQ